MALKGAGVLLLDGAIGTMLLQAGHSECLDMVSITHPADLKHIHTQYIEAGSDVITTNTFGAHPLLLASQGFEAAEAARVSREAINAAVRAARGAVEEHMKREPSRKVYVAGSVGAAMGEDKQAIREGYEVVIETLLDGGVDLILVETIYDAKIGAIAIEVAKELIRKRSGSDEVLLIVSATATTKQPRPIEILKQIDLRGVFAVGFNCGFGASGMLSHIEELACSDIGKECKIVAYPNAGVPDAEGQHSQSAEEFAAEMRAYIESGAVSIVGGCCGTTPQHIAAVRAMIKGE